MKVIVLDAIASFSAIQLLIRIGWEQDSGHLLLLTLKFNASIVGVEFVLNSFSLFFVEPPATGHEHL